MTMIRKEKRRQGGERTKLKKEMTDQFKKCLNGKWKKDQINGK